MYLYCGYCSAGGWGPQRPWDILGSPIQCFIIISIQRYSVLLPILWCYCCKFTDPFNFFLCLSTQKTMCRSRRSSCVPAADSWGRSVMVVSTFQPFKQKCFFKVSTRGRHVSQIVLRRNQCLCCFLQGSKDAMTPAVATWTNLSLVKCLLWSLSAAGSKFSRCNKKPSWLFPANVNVQIRPAVCDTRRWPCHVSEWPAKKCVQVSLV